MAKNPNAIVSVDIEALVANPRNPRIHSDSQIERLMASLRRDGQTKPVLARKANRMIIGGHGVTMAAKRLGWPKINVLLWDVDQATADRVMLADNRLADLGENDADRVADLLKEIGSEDWMAVGFSAAEVEQVFGEAGGELVVKEIDFDAISDDFWVSVRGPLARQADVLAKMKELLAAFTDCTIKMGTIAGD